MFEHKTFPMLGNVIKRLKRKSWITCISLKIAGYLPTNFNKPLFRAEEKLNVRQSKECKLLIYFS